MNGEEKLNGNEIHTDSKALKRIENFWYHYKWPTIIVCFFTIVFLVCTLQMCNKKSYDVTVVYAGPYSMDSAGASDVKDVLNIVIPSDYDEDGEKSTELISYLIYTKEQIEKIEAESSQYIDRAYASSESQNFYNYAATEAGICFVDPSLYNSLKESDRLISVTGVLGYAPKGLVDDNGVRLSETDIYNEYAVLQKLPADTVVCLLRKQLTKKEDVYAKEQETFKAIVNYNAAEK